MKFLLWSVVIVAVPLLSSAPLWADGTSVAILAGRWTYDPAKSRPIDLDLRITTTATGTLHAEGGSSAPYEFDLVGGSFPLSNGRTIAWVSAARDTWQVTKKKSDEVLETMTVTLATWQIPTDLQVFKGHFDGRDLAIAGPSGPTASTIAMRGAGRRRLPT